MLGSSSFMQQADAGGLAAAGGADEEDELAPADAHRGAVEPDGAAVVDLADVPELDDRNVRVGGPPRPRARLFGADRSHADDH